MPPRSAQSLRFRLIAAGSAVAILLVGTLIYSAVRGQARAAEADRAATAIGDMLELSEFDHAVSLLKKLEASDPDLLTYPRMVEVRERIEIAQGKESDRAVQFDKAMREAESAPVSAKPPPALEAARSLARLDTEKEALAALIARRAADLQAEQARREKVLDPRLDELGRAIARVEQLAETVGPTAADEATVFSPLADAQRQLTDLGPDLALAGEAAQGRARDLSRRLDAVRDRLDRRHQQAQLEDAITTAVAYSPEARVHRPVRPGQRLADLRPIVPRPAPFPRLQRHAQGAIALDGDRRVGSPGGRLERRPRRASPPRRPRSAPSSVNSS